ncbi:MAG: CBS domain-containing protein [Haloarculaceae archaeon]
MLVSTTVADVMSRPVSTVEEDDTARRVAAVLDAADVGAVVALDGGTPSGIVTESDLTHLLADGADVDAVTVAEIMSADLVTVAPDDAIEDAAELFRDYHVRRLPVVEAGELVGIVTTSDVARYLPSLLYRARQGEHHQPHYTVRPDTAYEHGDWEFECHSVTEGGVTVGDVVRFSKTLTDTDVRNFAEASGDTNRLHLDADYAAGTRFGRRIVHGTLVGGLISAALARLPGLTIYISQELTFRGPVDVGDRLTAVCEVIEDLGSDRYRLATEVRDETEGSVVIEGEATVIVDDLPVDTAVSVEELA